MIRLEKFGPQHYDILISWIDSESLLVQIAGRQMQFPLTREQLQLSQSDRNRNAFSIIDLETGTPIGHCELYVMEKSAKIDRVLIGDHRKKGKGLCKPLINLLLDYGFNVLQQPVVELNVFEWNTVAIKCYENCGLVKNPEKTMEFETDNQKWIAFNMSIDKATYQRMTREPGSKSTV